MSLKNKNRQDAGRAGGRAVTPRKSEAARENGQRGGRPSKAEVAYEQARTRVQALITDVQAHLPEVLHG